MDYRWIEDIEDFKRISQEWDMLVAGSGSQPFLLSDFIITWWKYFEKGRKLRIFVLTEGGRIAGGIPLYLKRGGAREGFANLLRYIGDSAANYTEPLYAMKETPVLGMLKDAVLKDKDIDALYLDNVREENGIMREYRSYPSDRRIECDAARDHFNMAIDIAGGKQAYLDSLPKKLKKDLRQKKKRAVKDYGIIKLKEVKGEEDTARYFGLYTAMSVKAFKERGRRNMLENGAYSAFFGDFLIAMDRRGMSDAFALYAGDSLLAVIFGYKLGPGFNWALTGFDYDFKYVRPGYLLVEGIIDEMVRRGDTICNCYGHESFFKNQWCNKRTPMYRFYMAKRSVRAGVFMAMQKVAGRLRLDKRIASAAKRLKRA